MLGYGFEVRDSKRIERIWLILILYAKDERRTKYFTLYRRFSTLYLVLTLNACKNRIVSETSFECDFDNLT